MEKLVRVIVVAVLCPFPLGNKTAKGTMSRIITEMIDLERFVGNPGETKLKVCL